MPAAVECLDGCFYCLRQEVRGRPQSSKHGECRHGSGEHEAQESGEHTRIYCWIIIYLTVNKCIVHHMQSPAFLVLLSHISLASCDNFRGFFYFGLGLSAIDIFVCCLKI